MIGPPTLVTLTTHKGMKHSNTNCIPSGMNHAVTVPNWRIVQGRFERAAGGKGKKTSPPALQIKGRRKRRVSTRFLDEIHLARSGRGWN